MATQEKGSELQSESDKGGSLVVSALALVLEVIGAIPAAGEEQFRVRTCFP